MTRNESTLTDGDGEFDDWIELFNLTDAAIELDGFTLADSGSDAIAFTPGAVVPAGGFLVLFADDDENGGRPEEPHFPFKLAGEGDTLVLRDAAGEVVDTLAIPQLALDESFGRSPDGAADAAKLADATPGAPNAAAEGEGEGEGEGECEPPAANDVVVNEVLVQNNTGLVDESGNVEPWIELFNAGDAEATLDGLVLADDLGLLSQWPLPAVIVPVGGFHVIFADQEADQGTNHASFLLSALDDNVVLADRCGTIKQTVSLAGEDNDISVGLLPDGQVDSLGARTSPTPNAPNN